MIANIKKLVNSCFKLKKLIVPGFTTTLRLDEELKEFLTNTNCKLEVN